MAERAHLLVDRDRCELKRACEQRCTLANLLVLYSVPCVLAWFATLFFGAGRGAGFLGQLRYEMNPPPEAPSVQATVLFAERFPHKIPKYDFSHAVLVEARWPDVLTVAHPAVEELTKRVVAATLGWCNAREQPRPKCWWRAAHGLFVERTAADADVANSDFITADEGATMIVLDNNQGFGAAGNHAQLDGWRALGDAIEAWGAQPCAEGNVSAAEAARLADAGVAPCTLASLFAVGSTHEQMMLYAATTSVVADFEHGDLVTLPVAMLVLVWACGPLAVLVLVSLAATVLCSFLTLSYLAEGLAWPLEMAPVPFPTFSPAIFINMMIALSFDYTLFLLTRYHEELARGAAALDALSVVLRTTGRVILVSGATLAITFFGTTFCSLKLVQALGWGGGVSCCVAVAVHLTLLPSLLLLLSPCYTPAARRCLAYQPKRRALRALLRLLPRNGGGGGGGEPWARWVSAHGGISRWVRLGLFCRDHRRKILAVSAAVLLPCAWIVGLELSLSIAQSQLTPRSAPSLQTYTRISAVGLNAGLLNPVQVLTTNRWLDDPAPPMPCVDDDFEVREALLESDDMEVRKYPPATYRCDVLSTQLPICNASAAPMLNLDGKFQSITPYAQRYCAGTCADYCAPNRSVVSAALFERTLLFREKVLSSLALHRSAPPLLRPDDVRDIATFPGNRSALTPQQALALLAADGAADADAAAYQAQFKRLASYDRSAAVIEVLLPQGQVGNGGYVLLDQLRAIVAAEPLGDGTAGSDFWFLIPGAINVMVDAMAGVQDEAPLLIGATALVVIVLVAGLAFKSLLVPVRLLATLVATLLLVAAAAVTYYQFTLGMDGLYWMTPISCGCLIIGLTVDYDVFLISRIYEFRLEGLPTEAAILRAMDTSSSAITTAGIIMIVAFSSLLFSSMAVLNQFGFMLVAAAFCDTFLVRALLVPTLMFCAVEWNWWPGRVPPPTSEGVDAALDAAATAAAAAARGDDGAGTAPLSAAAISLSSMRPHELPHTPPGAHGVFADLASGATPGRGLGGWSSPRASFG